jgi:7-alpha-hydroxysteroid dehydrogenase
MSFSIAGKTAIITGASSGVGLAIARHFAAEGANVVFTDVDEDALLEAVGDAADAEGATIRAFGADLTQKLAITNLVSATIDAFDRVDILVNAHRVVTRSDPLDPDADAVTPMLDQNLLTALRLGQAVARRMVAQAEKEGNENATVGTIINLSSISARRTFKGMMGYSIASAAIDQMTRSLAVALASNRVRVNGIAFASVLSNALTDSMRDQDGLRAAIVEATPLGRIAEAAELAETVQFLASGASDFITGQILTVDGGRSLLDTVRIAHA